MLPASGDIKLVFTSVDTSRRLHFGRGGCGTREQRPHMRTHGMTGWNKGD